MTALISALGLVAIRDCRCDNRGDGRTRTGSPYSASGPDRAAAMALVTAIRIDQEALSASLFPKRRPAGANPLTAVSLKILVRTLLTLIRVRGQR